MATTTTITSTYAGEFANKYISPALLGGRTLGNDLIAKNEGVIFKEVLQRVDLDSILKDATCDFDATSTLTMTERVLTVKDLNVNLQFCKSKFVKSWQAIEANPSAHRDMPATFQDYLLGYVGAKVAAKIEKNVWQGVVTNSGEFDGFTTLAKADGNTIKVAGAAITSANVIAELEKAVAAIPNALYGGEDLTIYASQNVVRSYIAALGGFGAAGLGANGVNGLGTNQVIDVLHFGNIKMVQADGLKDNDIFISEKENLVFGASLMSDLMEVKVLDMSELDGSDNIRVIMKMAAAVQYGISEDVIIYSTDIV
jgi:hypothetical protein